MDQDYKRKLGIVREIWMKIMRRRRGRERIKIFREEGNEEDG